MNLIEVLENENNVVKHQDVGDLIYMDNQYGLCYISTSEKISLTLELIKSDNWEVATKDDILKYKNEFITVIIKQSLESINKISLKYNDDMNDVKLGLQTILKLQEKLK